MAKEVLRRGYEPEFKREAVKLVKGGLSSSQVARELGLKSNMVSRWVRESKADPTHSFPGKGIMKPDEAELDRLRKEIVKLKAERDLLKNVWSAPVKQGHSFRSATRFASMYPACL
jgi:transposase